MPANNNYTKAEVEEICRERVFSPHHVISCYVSALRQYYSSPERVARMPDGGGGLRWSPNEAERTLAIEPKGAWKSDDDSKTPGLFVGMQALTHAQEEPRVLAMGHKAGGVFCGVCAETGQRIYAAFYSVVPSIKCVGREYLQAWSLAHDVGQFIDTYGGEIAKAADLEMKDPAAIQEPAPEPGHQGAYASLVTHRCIAIDSWVLEKEGLPATSMGINVSII